MNTVDWYMQLQKPSWAPPPEVFGPVWTVLYIGIAISFATVFWKAYKQQIPRAVALPFALNLVFNLAFNPIQFGLQSNVLAAFDIIAVLLTLTWAMRAVEKHIKWVAYAQIPYLLWVCFASALQFSITYINL